VRVNSRASSALVVLFAACSAPSQQTSRVDSRQDGPATRSRGGSPATKAAPSSTPASAASDQDPLTARDADAPHAETAASVGAAAGCEEHRARPLGPSAAAEARREVLSSGTSRSECSARDSNLCIPAVYLLEVAVWGELSIDPAKRWLRQRFGALRHCYERALEDDPWLAGNWAAAIAIDAARVCHVEPRKNELPPAFSDCLARAIERFDGASEGPATIEVNFRFRMRKRQISRNGHL